MRGLFAQFSKRHPVGPSGILWVAWAKLVWIDWLSGLSPYHCMRVCVPAGTSLGYLAPKEPKEEKKELAPTATIDVDAETAVVSPTPA